MIRGCELIIIMTSIWAHRWRCTGRICTWVARRLQVWIYGLLKRPLPTVLWFAFPSFEVTLFGYVWIIAIVAVYAFVTVEAGVTFAILIIVTSASSSSSTASWAFTVSRQCITASEFALTLLAYVRPLASVELRMSLEIMQSSEPLVAAITCEWLLLAMSEQMAFEIMMACEFSCAVGTFVFLIGI